MTSCTSPSLEESILNVVADRPESSKRCCSSSECESSDRLYSVKRKSPTNLPFSACTDFESSKLSSPTASGWYSNVDYSWTSSCAVNSYE
ncbi:hypothetical protein TNCV_624541 [Trichonephila clavipes]|nr:hypothetical protein TNCV_624541 [Trichonephila clavipes]